MWTFVYHTVFARGFTRIPFYLALPLTWQTLLHPQIEGQFRSWNPGTTQGDVWDRIQAKVNAMKEESGEA